MPPSTSPVGGTLPFDPAPVSADSLAMRALVSGLFEAAAPTARVVVKFALQPGAGRAAYGVQRFTPSAARR